MGFCELPETSTPECTQSPFDPCAGLSSQEELQCREITARCGPENLSPTAEDIAFCQQTLSPCNDPTLTAQQRAECEAQWKRCGPGGTEEGSPECFEAHDPCSGLTGAELSECQDISTICTQPIAPEDEDYCTEIMNPCNIPGLTPEEQAECEEYYANCGPDGPLEGTAECF